MVSRLNERAIRAREQERSGIRVLLVEDFEDVRQTILELLELLGYQVDPAEDMAEARSITNKPDVILCDIGLPDGDGCDLLQELRARRGWEDIPAVAISGYEDEHRLQAAERAGFLRYMVKPVSIHELDRALLEVARTAVP